jgi:hypothetical protein
MLLGPDRMGYYDRGQGQLLGLFERGRPLPSSLFGPVGRPVEHLSSTVFVVMNKPPHGGVLGARVRIRRREAHRSFFTAALIIGARCLSAFA